ncbi:MAG: glycogen debranching N-terminal domain-containing protein [Pseudomonadota bacterium]
MPDPRPPTQPDRLPPLSLRQEQQRKEEVLTHGTPSHVPSIADAIVIKDQEIFFLSERDGQVPLGGEHGFGLYYHDCRYLNGYEWVMEGAKADVLVASAAAGFMAVLEYANPNLRMQSGEMLQKRTLGIKWERILDGQTLSLYDLITFRNYQLQPVDFQLAFTFHAGFEDVFAVRGMLPEKYGIRQPPAWQNDVLRFLYEGADGLCRALFVRFSEALLSRETQTARLHLSLPPQQDNTLMVSLTVAEAPSVRELQDRVHSRHSIRQVQDYQRATAGQWLRQYTQVRCPSPLVERIVERALGDLQVLQSTLDGDTYFAAGVPWFVTLFGRDSALTALQTLAFQPDIAAQTLRLLAKYQGREVSAWRDEQPGKILHELRVGEMARLNEIPYTPYYGSIDATLLFLILLGEHAAWTGSLDLFGELQPQVELALAWIGRYGDLDGDGYVEYQSSTGKGLINQGWKDSGDAIVNRDGSLARPPIALVEVQAYVFMAKRHLAELYRRSGDAGRAQRLEQEAEALRVRFNKDFWLADKQFYALALQAGKQPATVITSNPGHALWAGIADADKARLVKDRLLAADMFSGWGIRTLATTELRYNPIAYHLGTVWPHDNALILAGLRRYGFDQEALRIFDGIFSAATHFHAYRLPELFAGFRRDDYQVPVRYPVADHPQAWAAASVLHMLQHMLGLQADGFARQLRIVRPLLPDFIHRLELHGLRVGAATVDLRFERAADGTLQARALHVDGELQVVTVPS